MNPLSDILPKRIIARLDVKNGNVVKGIMMEGVQAVGKPIEMSRQYYANGADEIILLDTVASLYQRLELPDIISQIVKDIFIPVCAGGGITSCQEAEKLFYSGADKICLNTAALETPKLISELSKEFGAQSVVLQIDVRYFKGKFRLFYNSGRDLSERNFEEWLQMAQDLGVGEILVTSIEKDGTEKGPDLPLLDHIQQLVKVPMIYGGGLASIEHMSSVLKRPKISAIALASVLHNSKANIDDLKNGLKSKNIPVRERL